MSDDSLLGAFTLAFEHGLLVIENSGTRASHDGWNAAGEQVHLDRDSLYVGVQCSVDGPVSVQVHGAGLREDTTARLKSRFRGELAVPSQILRVSDSDNMIVLSLPIPGERVGIELFVDDERWPARVVIALQ